MIGAETVSEKNVENFNSKSNKRDKNGKSPPKKNNLKLFLILSIISFIPIGIFTGFYLNPPSISTYVRTTGGVYDVFSFTNFT